MPFRIMPTGHSTRMQLIKPGVQVSMAYQVTAVAVWKNVVVSSCVCTGSCQGVVSKTLALGSCMLLFTPLQCPSLAIIPKLICKNWSARRGAVF